MTTTPPRPDQTGAFRDGRRRGGIAWWWWLLGLLLLAAIIAIIVFLATRGGDKGGTPAPVGTTTSAAPPATTPASTPVSTPVATPAATASPAAALVGGGGVAVKQATGTEAAAGVAGTVLFPSNSAALDAADQQVIAAAAKTLKAQGATAVVVGGYTDDEGRPVGNQPLSAQRATAVAAKLRSLLGGGVTVTTVDHGATGPFTTNATPAGKAQNRRAVISTSS